VNLAAFGSSANGLFLQPAPILEQTAGHLRWKVDYPPWQPTGSGSNIKGGSQPAKLPSFGGYNLGNHKPCATCT